MNRTEILTKLAEIEGRAIQDNQLQKFDIGNARTIALRNDRGFLLEACKFFFTAFQQSEQTVNVLTVRNIRIRREWAKMHTVKIHLLKELLQFRFLERRGYRFHKKRLARLRPPKRHRLMSALRQVYGRSPLADVIPVLRQIQEVKEKFGR